MVYRRGAALRPEATDRVALLSGSHAPEAALVDALGRADRLVRLAADDDELHVRLAAGAPWDLVVDAAGEGALDRLADLVGHLRAGGRYVCVLDPGIDPGLDEAAAAAWADRLERRRERLLCGVDELPVRQARAKRARATLALSVRAGVADGLLVAVNETPMLIKLHEPAIEAVLAARGGPDRVVASVPAAHWESRAVVRASGPTPRNPLPSSYDAPTLALREYVDVVCVGRQAAYSGTFVLPESFRDNLQRRLQNPALDNWTGRFVRRPEPPRAELAGSWYHLDTHVPGHFGHVVLEQLSHLWGWHEARRLDPSVRALVFGEDGGEPAGWVYDLLAAGGVPREAIHVPSGPVRVERLLASSPAYNIGRYAHPVLAGTWGGIGATLGGGPHDGPDRIFLTRTGSKRACRNRAEVEALFTEHGFAVLSPETLPLAEQVRIVRGASVVAGFAGSAMFHTAFAAGPQHVVAITTENYPAHNEHAIAALLGHRLDLAVCPPDRPRGPDFDPETFHSDYLVDLAGREGDFLRSVLREL